jgi:hypothetical protein
MTQNWVKVFSTETSYIVELLRGVLEKDSIKTFVVNKQDSMHIHLLNGEVELYVSSADVIRAKHLISKSEF